MTRSDHFEISSIGEMKRKHGLTAENRPAITLDPAKVPVTLRHLIPLAEQFGVSDDLIREDIIAKIPVAKLAAIRAAVEVRKDAFNEWLAGPEADRLQLSAEYIAFTCLRMVADAC